MTSSVSKNPKSIYAGSKERKAIWVTSEAQTLVITLDQFQADDVWFACLRAIFLWYSTETPLLMEKTWLPHAHILTSIKSESDQST